MRNIDFGFGNPYINLKNTPTSGTPSYLQGNSVSIGHTYQPPRDSLGLPIYSNSSTGYKPSQEMTPEQKLKHLENVGKCMGLFGTGGWLFGGKAGAAGATTIGGLVCPSIVRSSEGKEAKQREAEVKRIQKELEQIQDEIRRGKEIEEAIGRNALRFI